MPLEQAANGIKLRDFDDQDSLRDGVYDSIESSFKTVFPQSYGGVRMELTGTEWLDPPTYSISKQKQAMDQQKFLSRRLAGTLRLVDEETGDVLDETKKTLVRAPALTQRGTIIHNGNEYTVAAQARLLPGAYSRKKQNGEIEVQVNPRQGTGPAFRLHMEPETGILKLDMKKSSIRLYPLLKDMGYKDEDLAQRWGADLLKLNQDAYSDKVFDRAYERLVKNADKNLDRSEKVTQLTNVFNKLQVHRDTARITLPSALQRNLKAYKDDKEISGFRDYGASDDDVAVGVEGLLDITDKVIAVSKGIDEPDERDNLIFKRFHPLDKLIRERILLDSGKLRLNTLRMISKARSFAPLRPNHFDGYISQLVTQSSLSSPLEEINPLHLLEQKRRYTAMGEGGIQSDQGITNEAQNVMPVQFSFIDGLAGPESARAGVDGRFAHGARMGEDGKIYQRFLNKRTGKYEYLSPSDLWDKVVAMPV